MKTDDRRDGSSNLMITGKELRSIRSNDRERWKRHVHRSIEAQKWDMSTEKWVCEDHPTKEQEHRLFPFFWKRCGGAGMPEPTEENRRKGYCS